MAWIVLVAVLIGAAAALLARPFGVAAPGPPVLGGLTLEQLGEIVAVVLVAGVCGWLYMALRSSGSRAGFSERLIATILVTLLLGVMVVEILNLVHVPPILSGGNSTAPQPSPGSPTTGAPGPFPPLIHTSGVTLPSWAGYLLLGLIAALVAVALVPALRARAESRRRRAEDPEGPARAAQRAIEQTLRQLEGADPADARAAIRALYARLLILVAPRLGPLESRTPREIERESVVTLGFGAQVAESLRETFEEARYSTHPMTVEAVQRARAALAAALSDLSPPKAVPR